MDHDQAYANAAFIPDGDSYPARWTLAAAAFRSAHPPQVLAYGPGPREAVDLFLPAGKPLGTVVFIHGGYWMETDRSLWSHLAAGPLARGWAVALPSYDLCPAVRIAQITAQVARAVTAVADRVPGPLALTGHSAGGHLAARMGCADVALPVLDRVARIVPISPLADLAPLMRTAMNDVLRIDPAEARTESPLHHAAPPCPVTVWVGGGERPAFLDQARWLGAAWDCTVVVDPGWHHFDVIEGLERGESPLVRALVG